MESMIYFTAPWCGPCKTVRPLIEKAITEGADIEIVDIDQLSKEQLAALEVSSVPTLITAKNEIFIGAPAILKQIRS